MATEGGISISTRAPTVLGRALTNPVWGSRKDGANYFDVETEYKKNQSIKKRPDLPFDEALRYDMNLMWTLQVRKLRAAPGLVGKIEAMGGVEWLKRCSHTVGVKGSRWEGEGEQSNFIRVLIEAYKTVTK